MTNKIQCKEIGGEGVHVRDCHVCREIHYMDSASDYRESLQHDRHLNSNDEHLGMLDSPKQFLGSVLSDLLAAGYFLIASLIAYLLFRLILQYW